MKIIRIIILFVTGGMVVVSCKRQSPPSPAPFVPEFTFSGVVNGSQSNLQAGVNNYYMFTNCSLNPNGVYAFQGEFRDKTCSAGNCPNTLKITIQDYRAYSPLPTTTDSSLVTGYYSIATVSGASSRYTVQFFDSLYNGTAQSYLWNFGDGSSSSLDRPTHLYAHPGIYSVSLFVQSTGSGSSSLSNYTAIGQSGNPILVAFGGTASGNVVNFASSVGGGVPPYTYNWNFGDGASAITTGGTSIHTYSGPGVYPGQLSITDASNTKVVSYANIATNPASGCYLNFYPKVTTPVPNSSNLANVTLEWCDGSGVWWTSTNNNQPVTSMFQVLSVDNYQNNVSGQPTKKLHARISCTLYNGTNSILLSGDAVFSVAHL